MLAYDQFGRPVAILVNETKRKRIRGLEALKHNIHAAKAVADMVRTSLGPKGMDKIIVDPDGQVTCTNDGATIVDLINVENHAARQMVELSKSQDAEIGDGTTGVVVLGGAMLEQAEVLLDRGIHPIRIANAFERACEVSVRRLADIADSVPLDFTQDRFLELLTQTAMTTLRSKVVNRDLRRMAEIVVKAVMSVADLERRDVHLDMIKVEGKLGGRLEDTTLVNGVILDKEFSHPQMPKEVTNAKIAILTAPFELPKPKVKTNLSISTKEQYDELRKFQAEQFQHMLQKVKDSGANFVICQWGFEHEANSLLYTHGIPALRWVGGVELEQIAIATSGKIVPEFDQLSADKLGRCGKVREIIFGTTNERMTVLEDCASSKFVSILVRGGSQTLIEEAKRALHDAICIVRNLIRDSRIVYGGGAAEIACSLAVEEASNHVTGIDQYGMRAFAMALESVPIALAENSGLPAIESLAVSKSRQVSEKNPRLGIDALGSGTCDMREQKVIESLIGKQQQLRLATQVTRLVLKIDDVYDTNEEDFQ